MSEQPCADCVRLRIDRPGQRTRGEQFACANDYEDVRRRWAQARSSDGEAS